MISSVGSAGGGSLLAAVTKGAAVTQEVEIAVLKKNQDLEKANGESALKLIASATPATSSGKVDFYV